MVSQAITPQSRRRAALGAAFTRGHLRPLKNPGPPPAGQDPLVLTRSTNGRKYQMSALDKAKNAL